MEKLMKKFNLSTSDAIIVVLATIALFSFLFCNYYGALGKGFSGTVAISDLVFSKHRDYYLLLHVICPILTILTVIDFISKRLRMYPIFLMPVPVLIFIYNLITNENYNEVNIEYGAIMYLLCSIGCMCIYFSSREVDKIDISGLSRNDKVSKSVNTSFDKSSSDVTTDLIQLKELLDNQAITLEEYETIKAKLLSKLK